MDGFIFSIEFINEGRTLVIATEGSSQLIGFPVLVNDMANHFCPNLTRNMTNEEWRNYVGEDIAYEETCE